MEDCVTCWVMGRRTRAGQRCKDWEEGCVDGDSKVEDVRLEMSCSCGSVRMIAGARSLNAHVQMCGCAVREMEWDACNATSSCVADKTRFYGTEKKWS